MRFHLCLRTIGSEAISRLVDHGSQWAVAPRDYYFYYYSNRLYNFLVIFSNFVFSGGRNRYRIIPNVVITLSHPAHCWLSRPMMELQMKLMWPWNYWRLESIVKKYWLLSWEKESRNAGINVSIKVSRDVCRENELIRYVFYKKV
jgi:hypothetical protein